MLGFIIGQRITAATDNPEPSARRNYIPIAFVPRQNPFYFALPYNDVTHGQFKPEAPLVIPWFKQSYSGPGQSVCRNRWIAIRKGNRVCYAQWEDCGPFRTDHFQYVFGNERPKPNLNHGAGLDVSPAVRDYLGLAPTDVTDWQFVEVRDVPPGPWRSYGDNNHFVIARRQSEQRVAARRQRRGEEVAFNFRCSVVKALTASPAAASLLRQATAGSRHSLLVAWRRCRNSRWRGMAFAASFQRLFGLGCGVTGVAMPSNSETVTNLKPFGLQLIERRRHRFDCPRMNVVGKHDRTGSRFLENTIANYRRAGSFPVERINVPKNDVVSEFVVDPSFFAFGNRSIRRPK